jgi:hypothetical protein
MFAAAPAAAVLSCPPPSPQRWFCKTSHHVMSFRLPGVQARASQQVHRGDAGVHGFVQHPRRLRPGRGKRSDDLRAMCEEHHDEADAEIEQRQCGHSVPNGPPGGTSITSCNNIKNNNNINNNNNNNNINNNNIVTSAAVV